MEFIVGCGVVHYTFRICPISLAAVAVDSCPIWLDTASYEILYYYCPLKLFDSTKN